MYFSKIQQDIGIKYKTAKDQKIAEICLQLGEEWARIVSSEFSDFNRFRTPAGADPKKHKKKLISECKRYIKDNLTSEDVKSFLPVWFIPFIVQLILSTIITWVVKQIIDRLFECEK